MCLPLPFRRVCPVINLPCPYVFVSVLIEQIQLIVGKTADPAFLKKLTYIALTHHRKILQVDTCTAYHAGNNLFVEVDVVMSPDTPLMVSHDISESLQVRLAFFFCLLVHKDFERDTLGHANKKLTCSFLYFCRSSWRRFLTLSVHLFTSNMRHLMHPSIASPSKWMNYAGTVVGS